MKIALRGVLCMSLVLLSCSSKVQTIKTEPLPQSDDPLAIRTLTMIQTNQKQWNRFVHSTWKDAYPYVPGESLSKQWETYCCATAFLLYHVVSLIPEMDDQYIFKMTRYYLEGSIDVRKPCLLVTSVDSMIIEWAKEDRTK